MSAWQMFVMLASIYLAPHLEARIGGVVAVFYLFVACVCLSGEVYGA